MRLYEAAATTTTTTTAIKVLPKKSFELTSNGSVDGDSDCDAGSANLFYTIKGVRVSYPKRDRTSNRQRGRETESEKDWQIYKVYIFLCTCVYVHAYISLHTHTHKHADTYV